MNDIEFFFQQNGTNKYADFPKAALTPGFVNFSETVLLDIFWANKDTKAILQAKLQEDGVGDKKNSAKQFVLDHKAKLVDRLFGHNGYRNVSLQDQTDQATKYKLKGTICTNGLVCHLLAYDMSVLRPKAARENSQEDDNEDMDQHDVDDGEIDEPFLEIPDDFSVEDDTIINESGDNDNPQTPSSTSTAEPSIYKGLVINWRQGSKLLTNVEEQFHDASSCPSPDDTIIIGIDPGEKNAMTAALIDPRNPNRRHVVKIQRSFLYGPHIQFRNALKKQKDAIGITQLETNIPSFSRTTLTEYFEYMTAPSGEYPTRLDRIQDFYLGNWYRRKRWESQKAATACLDLAIKGILRMAGVNEGKKNDHQRAVIFCVGLGSFNSRMGLASKHTALLQRFVAKVCLVGSDESERGE
jgi:hypothetical protein